jgi:Zn-dependent M28 family amino/carboxypeptidase
VGYGVNAPERNWDDFRNEDLKGKIALILVNDPDFETGSGDFGGKAMTYYGRWTYKYEEMARRRRRWRAGHPRKRRPPPMAGKP